MRSLRSLHPKLQEKAISELNEDPDHIHEYIDVFKDWLSRQEHLKARPDDQFILSFLRGCKYDLEKCKEKIEIYYRLKTSTKKIYANRDPMRPELQEILSTGIMLVLPKSSDPSAPRYGLVRIGAKSNLYVPDAFKVAAMIQDFLIAEDDNLAISGISLLLDMSDLSLSNLIGFTPTLVKKTLDCFQKGYPLRIKGMHVKNPTTTWEIIHKISYPFLPKKLKSRISNMYTQEDVYKNFPKEVLPEEYGGSAGKLHDIIQSCKNDIENYRDWFLEDTQYGINDKKRKYKKIQQQRINLEEDSFKNLCLD